MLSPLDTVPSDGGPSPKFDFVSTGPSPDTATGADSSVGGMLAGVGKAAILKQLLCQLPVGVMLAEAPGGRVVFANQRLCQMLHQPVDALGTWEIYLGAQAFYPDGLPVLPGDFPLARSILHGDIITGESISIMLSTGERRHFKVDAAPLLDGKNEVYAAMCTFSDVTEQYRSEAALRQSESRYQRASAAAKVGVWELDFTTGALYLSPSLKALLGYGDGELPNTFEAWTNLVHADDQAPTALARDAYLTGTVGDYETEVRRRHKDGSYRWLLSRGTVLRDELGEPVALVGSDTDITERKRAEESLRESEERLRLGLEAGNTGTWDWDIASDRIQWSARTFEIHGVDPATWTGRLEHYLPLIHPEDRSLTTQAVGNALELGHSYEVVYRIIRPSGEVRWISTVGKPYMNEHGRPYRLSGASSDVTERLLAESEREALLEGERAARAEIERASRLKDEFLATLSHELRTPLNSIMGWASLLQRDNLEPELRTEGLLSIERNARSQAQIIEDLLDMSRILAGKLRLRIQPVEITQLIEAAIESVRVLAETRQIEILVQAEPVKSTLWADSARLHQILWNLLSNAVKFSPQGGKIAFNVGTRDVVETADGLHGDVVFTISDNGEGIPPEFLPYAFDRFRQADASMTRRHGGLGLGLSIVKHLVELHGGRVSAQSDGSGKGSTFTVTLPLNYAAVHLGERAHPLPAIPASPGRDLGLPPLSVPDEVTLPLRNVRVLVVEDERDIREMIGGLLTISGASVLLAQSASQARKLLDENLVDVVVSDLSMPEEDGFSFVRRLRQDEKTKNLPAIALSALARAQDRERALEAGFNAHVAKPIEPAAMIAVISRLARRER